MFLKKVLNRREKFHKQNTKLLFLLLLKFRIIQECQMCPKPIKQCLATHINHISIESLHKYYLLMPKISFARP